LSSRTLTRVYNTIVCGVVKTDTGTIDAPIGRHPVDRKRQAVHSGQSTQRVRPAVTHYEVVARYSGYTHLRCRLETGRTHQIRVHLAYLGFPVLGDVVYGRKKPELGMSSQCLHARMLRFVHPSTNKPVELSTDLPDYFIEVLTKLEKISG
jgi:23S rRNA pseudouridine1911/1915/1917 synthase